MAACFDQTHQHVPENPERLVGPEIGALCVYRGKVDMFIGQTMRVVARSYVWAPEEHRSDGYHGHRRYDWSVVAYGDDFKRQMVVDDKDLEPAA